MKVDGLSKKNDRRKTTWMKVVKIEMKKYNLLDDLIQDKSKWRNRIYITYPNYIEIRL